MSLSTEGRLTVAEAAASDDSLLSPDNAPLFRTTITVTQPAQDAKHATTLTQLLFTDNPYAQMGEITGYVEIEVGEPEVVEA